MSETHLNLEEKIGRVKECKGNIESTTLPLDYDVTALKVPVIKNMITGRRSILKNGQPFICYIEREKDRLYHAVGYEDKDMGYGKSVQALIIYNDSYDSWVPLEEKMLREAILGIDIDDRYYYVTGQRKGKEWYWSKNFFREDFKGMTNLEVGNDKGYRLRMDINNAGDAWISWNEVTGSIRMRDKENDRAIMYFVTYTDKEDDPRKVGGNYEVLEKAKLSS